MAYSEPVKLDSPVVKVRQIARLAQLILDLRNEYEQRLRPDTLSQLKQRAAELNTLAQELVGEVSQLSENQEKGSK
ncbi:hypothetical protein [Candidatus Chlorohelix sp.]|uniref:hypothetical protein n=1 Tax=Candidatus Chlorohelix sp. TaxID=3139201 RepID=UPI003056A224